MSDRALHHVVVRMLYDGVFADLVFESPRRALEGVDLSEEEIAWILRTDRRAFRTDPHRRARSLTGLLEEYPTASALLVRLARRDPPVAPLDDFFSSEEFHRGMQAGRSLAISFGEFLLRSATEMVRPRSATQSVRASSSMQGAPADPSRGRAGSGEAPDPSGVAIAVGLATLELAIARLRRLRLLAPPAVTADPDLTSMQRVQTSPTCAWVEVHPDTLDRFGEIRRRIALSEVDARAAVVDPAIDLGVASSETDGYSATGDSANTVVRSEPILLSAKVEPNPVPGGWMRVIDVELSPISEELAAVLNAAHSGISVPALLDQIRSLGADDAESREIAKDLIRDGLLIEEV